VRDLARHFDFSPQHVIGQLVIREFAAQQLDRVIGRPVRTAAQWSCDKNIREAAASGELGELPVAYALEWSQPFFGSDSRMT
jgi:hypothetical protein